MRKQGGSFQNISAVNVSYVRGLQQLSMGSLILKDRKIYFEYTAQFLKEGLELSPFKLPLKAGIQVCEDPVFEGLFGIFNDSLPDGWGRLLLDRKLMKLGFHPGDLSPLDRLYYVGRHGMGALTYEPEARGSYDSGPFDLDVIADEAFQFQENDEDQFVDHLLNLTASSAGARPKIVVNFDNEDWMIKFRSSLDPKDIGPIEYAYHLMAQAAHLDVPEARLFPSKTGFGYFGTKRFDRKNNKRFHMHTVSGLLHVDYRLPSLDYETIMKLTLWLTKDARECEKQLRAAIFNVLAHNRDDHAKNFSYLMDENGVWRVSPSYDLTFSSGPAGEHFTTIMGEGKNLNLSHLLTLAEVGDIEKQKALTIVDEVQSAVSKWEDFAQKANVSKASSSRIQKEFNRIAKLLFSTSTS